MDYISSFITAIVNNGIVPHKTTDIQPCDRFKRIRQASDKAGKRSISYWLKIEHDFAYGYARDFKTGIECRFKSYDNDPNLSRSDVTRIKAMLKVRQAEQDALIAERHAKIAVRSAYKWNRCTLVGSTPYLDAKNIPLLSAGIYGSNQLFIPLYENFDSLGTIQNHQTIYEDGTKHFPFGGKKQGCFHVIGSIDPTMPIILCEGFATGDTIHMATSYAVVVAFDAGNMIHVAKKIRKFYKNTPIIVAADNDESGTGQKSAELVRSKIENTTVIICPEKGKDFNDIGTDRTATCFGVQSDAGGGVDSRNGLLPESIPSAPSADFDHDWNDKVLTDSKNRIIATSIQNIMLYTIYHHDMRGVFAYDEFRQSNIIMRCPPWENPETFEPRPITDNDVTLCCAQLERFDLVPSQEKAYRAICVAAEHNKFNSAKKYIESMEWDGIPRLERFMVDIGCDKENPEYLSFVFKKWMTAAVKRIMEAGCQFDHVLILESQQQGFYKSTMLKELATFGGESYHTEAFGISDIGKEYSALKLQGVTFVELSELSGFGRKDDESIRHWITQRVDEVRLPYERTVSKYSRKFVLCATTNNYDYLKDPSGNRRYWPVTICKPIDIDFVKTNKDQLWAEAYHHYQQGLYLGPTLEENELAEVERAKRMQSDAWEDMVHDAIRKLGTDEFRTLDVMAAMELKTQDKNDNAIRRISKILKSIGYNNDPQWDNQMKRSVRVWSK